MEVIYGRRDDCKDKQATKPKNTNDNAQIMKSAGEK